MKPKKSLSETEIAAARQLRRSGMNWRQLGLRFDVTWHTVRRALDPEWADKRRAAINYMRRTLPYRRTQATE
jgi:hypothetical protein